MVLFKSKDDLVILDMVLILFLVISFSLCAIIEGSEYITPTMIISIIVISAVAVVITIFKIKAEAYFDDLEEE